MSDEIVVVYGEEGGAEKNVAAWFDKFPQIKFVPTKNINLAVSRNVGLNFCSGDIIALTDDDVQVSPDWVQRIRQLHKEHPEAGAIGGKVASAGNKLIDKIADVVVFGFPDRPGYLRTVAGVNASYKQKVITQVGEYDANLFRGEDVDYNWRILKQGDRIYYDPELLVYHYHRQRWVGLFRQVFMYGRAYYLVRRKWKEMYCVYPHGINNFKDVGKLGYFFLGSLIEPLKRLRDKQGVFIGLKMFPFLAICNIIWKTGMAIEGFSQRLVIASCDKQRMR